MVCLPEMNVCLYNVRKSNDETVCEGEREEDMLGDFSRGSIYDTNSMEATGAGEDTPLKSWGGTPLNHKKNPSLSKKKKGIEKKKNML